jgi:hypothetical protein
VISKEAPSVSASAATSAVHFSAASMFFRNSMVRAAAILAVFMANSEQFTEFGKADEMSF